MGVLIADDWKAIRDRMQEIEAERREKVWCFICRGTGWIPDLFGLRPRGYIVCNGCHNPGKRRRPLPGNQVEISRPV